MGFWNNVNNGFSKIRQRIAHTIARVREQRFREAELREKARPEAEAAYWTEREKYIKEEEIRKAKQRARPIQQQPYSKPMNQPSVNMGFLGGFNQPPISNQGGGMADYDFLGTKKKKGNKKQKTMGDMIKY